MTCAGEHYYLSLRKAVLHKKEVNEVMENPVTKTTDNNTKKVTSPKEMLIGYASLVLICLSVLIVFVVTEIVTIPELLSWDHPLLITLLVFAGSVGLILFGIILAYITPEQHIDETNKSYQDYSIPYIIVFMGLAGIFEELLFRGIIQNLLYMFFDMEWLAVVVTSLVFIAFHFSYFKKPIMFVNIAIPSFVFGVLYIATDNLLTPVLVHILMNVTMTILFKYNVLSLKKR